MLEAKSNLFAAEAGDSLSEPELAAVDEGLAAYEKLLSGLVDVPAPDGEMQRRLAARGLHQIGAATVTPPDQQGF